MTTYDLEADRSRARAALDRGPAHAAATLRRELAWYRELAADPAVPPADRELWTQLAAELASRIDSNADASPTLFGSFA